MRKKEIFFIVAASGLAPVKNNLEPTFQDVEQKHWAYSFAEAAGVVGGRPFAVGHPWLRGDSNG
ncbi:hypothetical protein L9W92_14275 [Pelotomaculum terephthalicicum JT]|uniref:hypothetical protein n=1 Tax=Pelotomaculum TaxID=191373 RepID=UPI0009C9D357|nr:MULTISPECIES: hypothetical protein [Pelotomaculum]MCG9969191.1 hypothetical protein [Pelotomaculum terephthalicicum JT]OPX89945.1 MAG: hypothetical protein A4E54_00779 [Pelotomaculum sp. PtaB.Bin117]OPY62181.1 MAG: hypothetical protein A4E56_01526 [Pelotomaculum sp. PtaU1.Bin065]